MEKSATITVQQPQPIITTVTIQPNENPPTSNEPGVTYVQLRPGHFKTISGILQLVAIVSRPSVFLPYRFTVFG